MAIVGHVVVRIFPDAKETDGLLGELWKDLQSNIGTYKAHRY